MSTNCEAVYNFLSEEGFRPQIDKEGDIVFKAEGDTYLICFNESDDDFMAVRKYRECPACFLIFLSVVSSSHETDRLSRCA